MPTRLIVMGGQATDRSPSRATQAGAPRCIARFSGCPAAPSLWSAVASSPTAAPSIATSWPPPAPPRWSCSRPAPPTSTPSGWSTRATALVRRPRRHGARPRRAAPARRARRGQRRRGPRRPVHLPGRRVADAPALGAEGHARCGTPSSTPGTAAPSWPARRPAPWCCATRWSTPAAAPSPSGSACVANLTVIPGFDTWSEDAVHRTRKLARGLALVGVPRRERRWSATPTAPGGPTARRRMVFVVRRVADLAALDARSTTAPTGALSSR